MEVETVAIPVATREEIPSPSLHTRQKSKDDGEEGSKRRSMKVRPSTDAGAAMNRSSDGTIFLTLEELVQNTRRYPLDRKSFLQFLKALHSEENFEFLVDIYEWKQGECDRERTKFLVEKYIQEGSEHQINLPAQIRKKILSTWERNISESLFEEAESEIASVFNSNFFVNQFLKESVRNIDEKEAKARIWIGFFNVLLWVGISILLSFSCASIWYRFLLVFPAFFGNANIIQSRGRFCIVLGMFGKKVACGMDWIDTVKAKEGDGSDALLLDRQVKTSHRAQTIKLTSIIALCTIVMVGLSFCLPQLCQM
jgi:hypothetical protein